MRISTAAFHDAALAAINERNASLLRTQQQLASGKRIQSPADDPAGAVRALELERALSESSQYERNANIVSTRLSLEEKTLADAGEVLQRVRELTVQANGGTLDQSSRQPIIAELQTRLQEMFSIANRRDASGDYLFSGFSAQSQPFTATTSGAAYAGDQGVRLAQISSSQRVADSDPGDVVFMSITAGNGRFTTSASAANTGDGIINGGTVSNPSAWINDTYTLAFTSASTWEVRDGSNAVVNSGTYVSGATIAFNGAEVIVTGTPASGDSFTLAPASVVNVFSAISTVINTLQRPTDASSQRAQFATDIGNSLTQLDNSIDHFSDIRASVGARLNTVDNSNEARQDRELELNSVLSQIQDLDYTEAITQLNLQQLGLQAAQSSYGRLAQLSLFDYL
jgi:flagellar hook-associated protein 3 FlgL